MSSIEELKNAISRLGHRELSEFRRWFEQFEAERFDQAIERDSRSGKLGRWAEPALTSRESARRLALLGGSEPELKAPRRRRQPE